MDDLSFIPLKVSFIHQKLRIVITLLAGLSVCLSGLVWFYKVLMVLVLLGWLIQQWSSLNTVIIKGLRCVQEQRVQEQRVQEQRVQERRVQERRVQERRVQGQWFLQCEDKEIAAELCGEQLVLPWLIVLNFKELSSRKKHSLTLWLDSADKEELRKLRVFLKFSGV